MSNKTTDEKVQELRATIEAKVFDVNEEANYRTHVALQKELRLLCPLTHTRKYNLKK